MHANTFGNLLSLTTFGESHGPAMGAVIDGFPAGVPVDIDEDIQPHLNRRRPGQSKLTTSRSEGDRAEVLSGVFEGKTIGSPIAVIVWNNNAKSEDYDPNYYRAGHADRTWEEKYEHRDYRGGGRASGRETVSRVIGGSFARLLLPDDVAIVGFTRRIGEHVATDLPDALTIDDVDRHPTRCPDLEVAEEITDTLKDCKENGDSRGGIIELWIDGVPPGLGDPVFKKMKNRLGGAFMSIGAVVGAGLGDAPNACRASGADFHTGIAGSGPDAGVSPAAEGIQGGITNGRRIRMQVYFKPASTVGSMAKKGRHDPCIVPRAIPVVESMAALVLADHFMARKLDRR